MLDFLLPFLLLLFSFLCIIRRPVRGGTKTDLTMISSPSFNSFGPQYQTLLWLCFKDGWETTEDRFNLSEEKCVHHVLGDY